MLWVIPIYLFFRVNVFLDPESIFSLKKKNSDYEKTSLEISSSLVNLLLEILQNFVSLFHQTSSFVFFLSFIVKTVT